MEIDILYNCLSLFLVKISSPYYLFHNYLSTISYRLFKAYETCLIKKRYEYWFLKNVGIIWIEQLDWFYNITLILFSDWIQKKI